MLQVSENKSYLSNTSRLDSNCVGFSRRGREGVLCLLDF